MKKKVLLSMTLLSTVVAAGSMPLTTCAAETEYKPVWADECYKVYIGQGIESLSQILQNLGIITDQSQNPCPDEEIPEVNTPAIPNPDTPEAPNPPAIDTPETQEPDSDISDETTLSYAEQIVKLVNEERAKAGLPVLKMDSAVTSAANIRAKEIKQKFAHTRPDGSSFSSVLKEQGVTFRGSGENIAWGQKSPEQVMNGWMNSEGHRANILNKNFTTIGVGHYQDADGMNYWVQLFTY